MVRLALALSALAACGRVSFEPADATDDAPPCTYGAFGTPVRLPGPLNSSVDDWTPSISTDGLTLTFYSQRPSSPGAPDLWISTRATATAEFPAATVLTAASSPARDQAPHLTADGLELFFVSDRDGTGTDFDIYRAKRPTALDEFSLPTVVEELSTSFDEDTVWISADGLRVMFSSNRDASYDLYTATRPDRSAAFSEPAVITELSSPAVESSPGLSADERELVFVSNRTGGIGKYDVWHASRPDRTSPFSTPTNLATVSSPEDDWGLSLSADGLQLYYSYDATLSGGDADVWVATRACP